MDKRLFIVSNRLPLTISREGEKINVKKSSGGLVTAIGAYLSGCSGSFNATCWVGVAGEDPAEWNAVYESMDRTSHEYLPVFVTKKIYDQYYNGFSNSTLWPLFHYFPSFTEYNHTHYNYYRQVNELFANLLQKHLRPHDTVWIQDYHLMPLAAILRERIPGITIGFFLHIPFPSYEIFRLLPRKWQQDILVGLLGADLIGFHTIDYATHFLKSVQRVLGFENELNLLTYQNRLIKVDVFPISIDFEKFHQAYDTDNIVRLRNNYQDQLSGKRIIFSVDRLDYTKGVSHRLEGYRLFLEQNPQYREKVVFILVVVPSREYIPRYAERKRMIDEMIGNINSHLGTINWQPVIYRYNHLNFDEMLALYTACDIALITPLRDGMNLVAKEFVASRKDKRGVLLLSEMAGAARELTAALHINPNDVEEISIKIREGFQMNVDEQMSRMIAMQQRIATYDVKTWANDFIVQLQKIKQRQSDFQVKFIDDDDRNLILGQYNKARHPLILLDYDGTLVPYSSFPTKARPGVQLKELLTKLAANGNEIYLTSGRSSEVLDGWFSDIPVNLIAEHGSKIRKAGMQWDALIRLSPLWRKEVKNIMLQYVKRCANSFLEEKEYCMVWHYRNADPEQGKLRATELASDLADCASHFGMQVMAGNKTIEVKPNAANKGTVINSSVKPFEYDFILAAGDDKTDEDMFRVLSHYDFAYTIKVGTEASFAKYNLHTSQMVVSLLQTLCAHGCGHRFTAPALKKTE